MDEGNDSAVAEYMSLVGQRADFLEYLCETAASKRDVIGALGHSRSTVDRALNDLQEAGLVRYEDGAYETTATGVVAVKQYRTHIDRSADIRAAREALAPLPPDTRLDPAMVVGASINLVEEPRPYGALQPVESALSEATRIRALLPNVADSRYVDRYAERARAGADVSMVVDPDLCATLTREFPDTCREMATGERFEVREGATPPFGVVVTGDGEVTSVSVIVYAGNGSVHAVLHTGTLDAVRWAENLVSETAADADPVTDRFRSLDPGPESTGEDDPGPVVSRSPALPVELETEGIVELTPAYFDRRSAVSPLTGWQTELGLPEVAAGYAVDRTSESENGRRNITTAVLADLREGRDRAVLGPPGSGKSTVCKQVAYRWYERGHGRVFYRESDSSRTFESTVRFRDVLRRCDGHTLVVFEDAVRKSASEVFRLMIEFLNDDTVTFLLDSRTWEWENADIFEEDVEVGAFRQEAIDPVFLPRLDERECERFIDHAESVTDESIAVPAGELLAEVRDTAGAGDREAAHGEALVFFHLLSTYANPADAVETTGLVRTVQDLITDLRDRGETASRVGLLVNLLNAANVTVYPEYCYALAEEGAYGAVERAIEHLEGEVIFSARFEDAPGFRTIHESWSAIYLERVLELDEEAYRAVGECLSALLSLADDPDRRDRIERARNGASPGLERIADDPGRWADETVERLFELCLKRPKLAPLFGRSEYSRIDLPEACSASMERTLAIRRADAYTKGRYLDRADEEYEYLLDLAERVDDPVTARELRARGLRGRGRVAQLRSEFDDSERALREALELFEALEDRRGQAECYWTLGQVLEERGEFAESERLLREAADRYGAVDDDEGLAKAYARLGNLLRKRERLDESGAVLRDGLELARASGSQLLEATCLNNLASTLKRQDRMDEAERYLRTSLEIDRRLGNREGVGASLTNLVEITAECDPAAALEYQQRALETYRDIGGDREVATCIHNLGKLYRLTGEFDRAGEHLRESLDRFREIGNTRRVAATHYELGELERDRERFDDAIDRYDRALELADEADLAELAVTALEAAVEALREQGATAEAVERCRAAVERAERAGLEERRESLVATCDRLEGAASAGG